MEMSRLRSDGAAWRSKAAVALRPLEDERVVSYVTIGVIVAALILAARAIGSFSTFYSIDGAIKYLASVNIVHHPLNPAISYPYGRSDPNGTYTLPLTAWYNGHDYAGYSLLFEYMSGFAIALFGTAGVIVPPIVATGLLLIVQVELADLVGLQGNRVLLLVATVVATPVLFYSLSFWEHTWGVALVLAGIAVLLRACSRPNASVYLGLLAGGLFAGAVLMRRETAVPALLAIVITVAAFRSRQALEVCLLAGCTLCLPILLILQLHPEPLAVGLTHASPGRASVGVNHSLTKLNKLEFLAWGGPATALFFAITATVLALRRFKPAWAIPFAAISSVVVGLALAASMLFGYTWSDENVLAFCPLAIWGVWSLIFVTWSRKDAIVEVVLWVIGVVGAISVGVLAFDDGGSQWGPRYLLFAFPIMVLLALKGRQRMLEPEGPVGRRAVNYGFMFVLATSVFLQLLSLKVLTLAHGVAATDDRRIAALHSNVVVSSWPVIDVLAPTYERNTYLYAPTQADMVALMHRLRERHTHRLVMLCEPAKPCRWNGYVGWDHSRIRKVPHSVLYTVYRTT